MYIYIYIIIYNIYSVCFIRINFSLLNPLLIFRGTVKILKLCRYIYVSCICNINKTSSISYISDY